MARSARVRALVDALRAEYPEASTELAFATPFELLVATVLSAQATDRAVNAVTPVLFARFPDVASLAEAPLEEIEDAIRTLGLYRTKARHLRALAQLLRERHDGEVPARREALEALPGVGRKTASVVLASAFGVPALAVDTHVFRLAHRLGLSRAATPEGVERDLRRRIARADWIWAHHALIQHGRRVCHARRPACERCRLRPYCPRVGLAEAGGPIVDTVDTADTVEEA
jgi:endonuclease-3